MRLRLILLTSILMAIDCSSSYADPIDQVLARLNALEKRNEELAVENAALKQRVSRLEHKPAAVAVAALPSAPPAIASAAPVIVTTSQSVTTSAYYPAAATPRDLSSAAFSWTGMYVGLHAGGAAGDLEFQDTVPTAPLVNETFGGQVDASGFLGGVQLGLNKQYGSSVLGGEVSLSGADVSGSQRDCSNIPIPIDEKCTAQSTG